VEQLVVFPLVEEVMVDQMGLFQSLAEAGVVVVQGSILILNPKFPMKRSMLGQLVVLSLLLKSTLDLQACLFRLRTKF
jgi:hypothetical protein